VSLLTVAAFVGECDSELASFTVIVKSCASPFASDGSVHVTVPPVCAQPELAETYVMPLGSVSTTLTFSAVSGPLFLTAIVYLSFVPGVTGDGEADFLTWRSARHSDLSFTSEKLAVPDLFPPGASDTPLATDVIATASLLIGWAAAHCAAPTFVV